MGLMLKLIILSLALYGLASLCLSAYQLLRRLLVKPAPPPPTPEPPRRVSESWFYQLKLKKLKSQSNRDALTHLYHKGYFMETLAQSLMDAKDRCSHLGLIFVDIDNFKQLNDTYGHNFGDTVLIEVSRTMRKVAADHHEYLVCRYGGEELTIIVQDSPPDKVELLAHHLCHEVGMLHFPQQPRVRVTLSVGVYTVEFVEDKRYHYLDSMAIIEQADRQLYLAKQTGKNRVCTLVEASRAAEA